MDFQVQISFALFMDEDTEPGSAEDRRQLTEECRRFVHEVLFGSDEAAFEAFHQEFRSQELERPSLRRVETLIRRQLTDGGAGAGIPNAQAPSRPLEIAAPVTETPYDPEVQRPYGYTINPPECVHQYVVLDDTDGLARAALEAGAGPEELRAFRIPVRRTNILTRGHLGVQLRFWEPQAEGGGTK